MELWILSGLNKWEKKWMWQKIEMPLYICEQNSCSCAHLERRKMSNIYEAKGESGACSCSSVIFCAFECPNVRLSTCVGGFEFLMPFHIIMWAPTCERECLRACGHYKQKCWRIGKVMQLRNFACLRVCQCGQMRAVLHARASVRKWISPWLGLMWPCETIIIGKI